MHFYGYSHTNLPMRAQLALLQAQPPGYVTLMAFWMAESHITFRRRGREKGQQNGRKAGKRREPLGGPGGGLEPRR